MSQGPAAASVLEAIRLKANRRLDIEGMMLTVHKMSSGNVLFESFRIPRLDSSCWQCSEYLSFSTLALERVAFTNSPTSEHRAGSGNHPQHNSYGLALSPGTFPGTRQRSLGHDLSCKSFQNKGDISGPQILMAKSIPPMFVLGSHA